MSNYTQSLYFVTKDQAANGTDAKVLYGYQFDTEFSNISTAIATKYDSSTTSITLTGAFSAGSYGSINLNTGSLPANGIYSPSANAVTITTNSLARMSIDSNGKTTFNLTSNSTPAVNAACASAIYAFNAISTTTAANVLSWNDTVYSGGIYTAAGAGTFFTVANGSGITFATSGGTNRLAIGALGGVNIYAGPTGVDTLTLALSNTNALIATSTTIVSNAGASVGTLTNAPSAGNPTKWIRINDNGTIRSFPAW